MCVFFLSCSLIFHKLLHPSSLPEMLFCFFFVWKPSTNFLRNIQVPPRFCGLPWSPNSCLLSPPLGRPLAIIYIHICLCIKWVLENLDHSSFIFVMSTTPSSVPSTNQVLKESLLIKFTWERYSNYVSKCPRIPQRYLCGCHKADGKAEQVNSQKSK